MEEISLRTHGMIYDTLFGSLRANNIIGAWSLEFGVRTAEALHILYGVSLYHNWLGQADNHGFISDI